MNSLILLFASAALAGPSHGEMTPREKALHRIISSEVQTADALHDAVGMAIEHKDYTVGAACIAGNDKAKGFVKTGKAAKEAHKWQDAYKAYREATDALEPCATEFADKKAPAPLKAAIRKRITASHDAVSATREFIIDNANPAANQHHTDAKAHHAKAKKHVDAGEGKAAVHEWFSCMRSLEKAVWTAEKK